MLNRRGLYCLIVGSMSAAGVLPAAEIDPPARLVTNGQFIAAPAAGADRDAWLTAVRDYRRQVRGRLGDRGLDLSLYDRPEFAWAARAFACHFTFMYDREFYDPSAGRYTLDSFLAAGEREFGGYQAIVLWHAYPRIGFDPRNQFDMYRDMPGGLAGLRALIREAHRRQVRVFLDYNPWDTGTRREGRPDEEVLAELIVATEADGIFLDTLAAGNSRLRTLLDAARPGVVLEPELYPAVEQLPICSSSWAQWLQDPQPPGMLHHKWIEPRHLQHQIRRWDRTHREEIETAFFNGSGMLIWENVFGTYNPWPADDRAAWRRAAAILNRFPEHFTAPDFEPFVPVLADGLFCHRWPGPRATLYTLRNLGVPRRDAPLLEVPRAGELECYDLWNGRSLRGEPRGDRWRIFGSLDRLGCIAVCRKDERPPGLSELLHRQRPEAGGEEVRESRLPARAVIEPLAVAPTPRVARDRIPPGMVLVPGGEFRMKIQHRRRECGCYPDPGTPPDRWPEFLRGTPHDGTLEHHIGPRTLAPFFIDAAEVSNAEYQRFLEVSGYRPQHPENFLAHWPGGKLPAELADHPVVYVDLDDARAYARWAGKRLPTEAEWQRAAQGPDGRRWPWGDEFAADRCHSSGRHTMPVRSLPEGRSPSGCYHLAGNVWEWTESERDDGHTRFVMLRGGSYFRAEGSIWYADGGAQPCDHHAKFIRMWPGLDRCATIGFRCVVDAQ